MPRSWPERLAKRVPRLVESLNKLEDKGRTSDPKFDKLLKELAELCDEAIENRQAADRGLQQALYDASVARKKIASARDALEAEKEQFRQYAERERASIKTGKADIKRRSQVLERERREAAGKEQAAGELHRKCQAFIAEVNEAFGRL